jgi:membrane-bound lytic murein transglycosylase D
MRLPWLIALACAAVLGAASDSPAQTDAAGELERLRAEVGALRERIDRLEASLAVSLQALHYVLPETMEFAGEPVPLDRWDTRERLEREFLLSLGNRAQVILWLKRSARYFPYIQEELKKAGLPDDLKYVAVIESALLPTAVSPANALGIWQFIATTGRRYGLAITPWWDERRNPQSSTAAALAYLKDLHARFRSWPLALAGYNAGEGRVEDALRRQGVATYYQVALPSETERYVFRALAAKLILSEPERYGFQVPSEQLYQPLEADTVEVSVRNRLAVADLARAGGSFYREIRELNPGIVQDYLPKGRYLIRIPKGRAGQFAASVSQLQPR